MQIKSAEFITSCTHVSGCPELNQPEFALIGRSNVGKSSLLNALVGRNSLAKTSSTPGRTQLINLFAINNRWTLVDLPGYGFAKLSKQSRVLLEKMISGYLTKRTSLSRVFVLIDSRHPPQTIDLEFVEWLMANGVPMALVFTKSDKVSPTFLRNNVAAFLARVAEWCPEPPPVFGTSAKTGEGRKEILAFIGQMIGI
jgi:GTP-binding protein